MDDQRRPAPTDRREALKARHRRAIVDAAAALMREIGGTSFTVDQLAERADVSRRTVFNHFATLDDIVLEVFGEMLATIIDDIDANLASQATERSGVVPVFDQVTAAIRSTDLVAPVIELTRIFGDGLDLVHGEERAAPTSRQAVLFERAVNGLGARISTTVLRHHPTLDPFELEVMCGALVSGALVAHQYWYEATGAADTPESRQVWDGLLDRLLAVARSGYSPLPTVRAPS